MTAYHRETITRHGLTFAVEYHHDHDSAEPWEECDGHGPVTNWETRDKRPGELILNTDGHAKRFYNYAEACRIAQRDGWNAAPYDVPGETPRQQAARAALADFERLRAWCADEWHWCGVVVALLDEDGEELPDSASLWGIESDATACLESVAAELADEVARSAPTTLAAHAAAHQAKAAQLLALAGKLEPHP
jgi:hypothetical protein